MGFFAIDPARAATTAYTGPYVQIEGAYLVRNDSPIRANDEVDRDGIRVAVGNKSAYDLYLARNLKKAKIERAPTSPAVVDYFLANKLDVAAGVKQQLEMDAKRLGGLRLLPGRFMVINQAMGMARGKEAGANYLASFIEEMKSGGFVAEALARHRIEGAGIAPPGGRPCPRSTLRNWRRSCTGAARRHWARCTPVTRSSRWCLTRSLRTAARSSCT